MSDLSEIDLTIFRLRSDPHATSQEAARVLASARHENTLLRARLAAAERERDEARAELATTLRGALDIGIDGISTAIKLTKGHEAALSSARLEGRIEGMQKAVDVHENGEDWGSRVYAAEIDNLITAARAELAGVKEG